MMNEVCGFAGVAGISHGLNEATHDLVGRMRETLIHRGPDASGQWGDEKVVLGHQRLSILDLTDAGAQPMFSASKRLVLLFNGEIYNYRDIAQRLTEIGWVATSGSDSEVLVEAIERWGIETVLDQADGMFSFALYDRHTQELILCRDRFGEKPLYYGVQNGLLYFASELRAFDLTGGPTVVLDEEATVKYFRYGFVPAPNTMYQGFFKVRPATILRFDLSTNNAGSGINEGHEHPFHRYWQIPGPQPDSKATRLTSDDELHDALRVSVTRRLISDRPLGAFLSGGIDSSLTCALAAEAMTGSLRTFNMSWKEREYDESIQARHVASVVGAVHTQVELPHAEMVAVAANLAEVLDEPNADSSLIGMYLVAREARKQFVVALSGDGGDEMFGGYNRHLWLGRTAALRNRLPRGVRGAISTSLLRLSPAVEALTKPLPLSRRPRLVADKMRKLGRALNADDVVSAYESVVAINSELPGYLDFSPEIQDALGSRNPSTLLWGLRAADVMWYLPDDILAKVDRGSMAVSLESRTAFLNPDVAQIAMNMSYDELLDGAKGKSPLRRLLKHMLPDCDFDTPKTGFGVPFASLMRGPAANLTAEAFESFMARDLPTPLRMIDWPGLRLRFLQGDDSCAVQLWSILVFELWASKRRHPIAWF